MQSDLGVGSGMLCEPFYTYPHQYVHTQRWEMKTLWRRSLLSGGSSAIDLSTAYQVIFLVHTSTHKSPGWEKKIALNLQWVYLFIIYWIRPKAYSIWHSALSVAIQLPMRRLQADPEFRRTCPTCDSHQLAFEGILPPAVKNIATLESNHWKITKIPPPQDIAVHRNI